MPSKILSLIDADDIRTFYDRGYWRDRTIYDVARTHGELAPDKPAIRDRDRCLTYRTLIEHVDALAADLPARGARPGSRVALWMPDRIESVITILACSRNGYVCCPSLHRHHTTPEVIALLERMRCTILVREEGFGANAGVVDVNDELARVSSLRHVYGLAPRDPQPPFASALCDPVAAAPPAVRAPDRVSYIAFTSGSTGQPKGVMHSDNTQLVTADGISRDWNISRDSVVCSLSPFSHNLGMGAYLTTLVGGGEFVIHDLDRRRESLVDRLIETGATYLVGVPTHAADIMEEMRRRRISRLGRVKAFRVSGAAAPRTLFGELIESGIQPQSGYGMTETNGHQYTRPGDPLSLIAESCGRACTGYEIRIFDQNDPDHELPLGETGLVAGRGASLMLGYFDDQTATENAFNRAGWFLTGDLGWIDADGYLRLTGREKDVIIRGGHNISPERIEELAMRHDTIARAAVLPIRDERLGERACIAIMLRDGTGLSFDAVLEHLAVQGLPRNEMPEFGIVVNNIPLMSNGKFRKRDLLAGIEDGSIVPTAIRDRPVTGAGQG